MDFLDPQKKRSHNRRLFIGYILAGVAVLMAAIILIFLTNGYDVDRKTGEVIQNGLIFADTAPESANIFLNNKDNGTTNKRLTVPAGNYDIELRRDGYRTWKKTIQLEGSSIERLVYPRLFPVELTQATSNTYEATPSLATQSPDRRWILVAKPGSLVDFQVFDTNSPKKEPSMLVLATDIYTNPESKKQSLEVVEWSSDNRHLLLKRNYDDSFEFIVFDREDPANAININKLLAVNPSKITLRDKKVDELYLYDTTSKQISMANLKNKEVKILINDVANYKSYGSNMILFATSDVEKPGKTIIKLWDTDKAYTVHVLNESSVLLDMAEFDGSWYVALAPSIEDKIYIIKDPFDKIKDRPAVLAKTFAVMRLPEASFISFSANTRFLSAQAGNKFAVYDFETNRRFNYELEGEIPVTQQISWMDGHRFAFNHDNKTVVVEFDGTNKQELTNLISGATPFFTRDYQRLYTLTANKEQDTKVDLIRSSLKVDQDP